MHLTVPLLAALAPYAVRPEPGEARRWLARELANPVYHQESWLERIARWIDRALARTVATASGYSLLTIAAASLALVVLAIALMLLISRARRDGGSHRGLGEVLPLERVSASEHLREARAAYDRGDHDTALVEGFRALVMAQIEAGQIDDAPGATAGELAAQLSRVRPELADEVEQTAHDFDAVAYGDQAATAVAAQRAIGLAETLMRVHR